MINLIKTIFKRIWKILKRDPDRMDWVITCNNDDYIKTSPSGSVGLWD
jgi:hypothetical protein